MKNILKLVAVMSVAFVIEPPRVARRLFGLSQAAFRISA